MMAAALTAAMTLGELLGPAAGLHAEVSIGALVLDSREVTSGAAFVALEGATRHGLEFASDALARGAAIVLYEPTPAHRNVPEPSLAVPGLAERVGELARTFYTARGAPVALAGVTGTNGKTTVSYLVAQAASRLGPPCGYIGTLGFGVPPSLEAHGLTTPDCFTLHREIATLGAPRVALEVSSHALAQDRIAGLEIATAAFTNLTRDHLDEHGDFAGYAEAKARLFTRPGLRTAVVNIDDAFGRTLLDRLARETQTIRTSLGRRTADLSGTFHSRGLDGFELEIAGTFGAASIRSALIGRFNAENMLVALGTLLAWETPLAEAAGALAECRPAPGRFEIVPSPEQAPTVIVDYAHTPDALERVLTVLRGATRGEIWCVFGCGGERDRGKREVMGRVADRGADHIVLTDDNPRTEDPEAIVVAIRRGIEPDRPVVVEHARERAIRHAVLAAGPGDVVLVAGKGHETTQRVGPQTRPFDDRIAAAEALEARA